MLRRVRKLAPQGLEKGKSYCENTKKPATSFPSYDPNNLYAFKILAKDLILVLYDFKIIFGNEILIIDLNF